MASWLHEVRKRIPELVRAMVEHDLLTAASAIAFQVLLALMPFMLFLIALAGFLDLGDVWTKDLAKEIRPEVSADVFRVIDDTVRQVLSQKQLFWLSAGLLLSIWEISAAVRGVMGALDRVYKSERERSTLERYRVSLMIAPTVGAFFLLAFVIVRFGPLLLGGPDSGLVDVASFVGRWTLAAILLGLAVGLLVHRAPTAPQGMGWVTFGSAVVIAGWIVMSIGFGLYLSFVAFYDSIFGSFATVFVLMLYLYFSATVFLAGAQLDAIIRTARSGSASGIQQGNF